MWFSYDCGYYVVWAACSMSWLLLGNNGEETVRLRILWMTSMNSLVSYLNNLSKTSVFITFIWTTHLWLLGVINGERVLEQIEVIRGNWTYLISESLVCVFADKRWSFGRYSSLTDSGHGVKKFGYWFER
jgi:hypothetical protein